jgi:WD40 repeat protein
LWDTRSGKQLQVWPGHNNLSSSRFPIFTADGKSLISGGTPGVDVWDVQTRKLRRHLGRYGEPKEFLSGPYALSADGKLLASSDGGQRMIHLWNLATGQRRFALGRTSLSFNQLVFSPDGKKLAGGGTSVYLWDMSTAHVARTLPRSESQTITFLPHNKFAAGGLNRATIWDLGTGQIKDTLLHQKVVRGAAPATMYGDSKEYTSGVYVSPGGKLYITQGNDPRTGVAVGVLEVREVATGKLLRSIKNFYSERTSLDTVVWTPDGTRLAYGGKAGVELWNLETGTLERTFPAPVNANQFVRPRAISLDGKVLVGQSECRNALLLWEIATGKLVRVILGGAARVALSPDGKLLAVNVYKEIRLYDARSTAPEATTGKPAGSKPKWALDLGTVESDRVLAFSPNGELLATSDAGTVKPWNLSDGRLRVTLLVFPPDTATPDTTRPDWLIYTPRRYYDASPGAEKFIGWRVGHELFPAARYAQRYHRPDLVQQALHCD